MSKDARYTVISLIGGTLITAGFYGLWGSTVVYVICIFLGVGLLGASLDI